MSDLIIDWQYVITKTKLFLCIVLSYPEAEFLDEIQTKVLKVFSLLFTDPNLQLCLETYISSNSRNLLQFLQFSY
jgi:hypothetical protein